MTRASGAASPGSSGGRSGRRDGGRPGTTSVEALADRLDEGLERLGGPAAALGTPARETLLRFVLLLEKWNRVHNLTAVRDAHEMIGRHLLDSLVLLPWIDAGIDGAIAPASNEADGPPAEASHGTPAARRSPSPPFDLLDIGSGGGLPVLPLAIARPTLHCLSVDAVEKKVRFQRQAVLELGLSGVEARHARIEAVADTARLVVSRAFASPGDFLRTAASRCAPGGRAIVMLGRRERLPGELPAPFALEAVHALDVPFASGARHVAVCRAPDRPAPDAVVDE